MYNVYNITAEYQILMINITIWFDLGIEVYLRKTVKHYFLFR